VREAKRLYTILGHGERVDICEAPGPHGFGKYQREASLRWMRRWLMDGDATPSESPPALAKDAELQVTQRGQVVPELKGRTACDFNLDEARRLTPAREAFWRDNPREKCLAEEDNMCTVANRSLRVYQNGGYGTHVVAPHPRHLVDPGALDPAVAATYA
jgi:alcohol dehydrogenase/propanol-preferring alcohol dehydrogenase